MLCSGVAACCVQYYSYTATGLQVLSKKNTHTHTHTRQDLIWIRNSTKNAIPSVNSFSPTSDYVTELHRKQRVNNFTK